MKNLSRSLFTAMIMLSLLGISQQAWAQSKTSTEAHSLKNEELKEYLGKYDPDGTEGRAFSITISLDGEDRLMAQPTNKSQPNTLLAAEAKDKFNLVGTGGLQISFTRDENDKIVSLRFSQGSQGFTAKKAEEAP